MLLDVVLTVVCLTALWLINRPETVAAVSPGVRDAVDRWRGRLARPLRDFYPTVTRQAGFDPETWRPSYWSLKLACTALPPLAILEVLAALDLESAAGAWLFVPALVGFFLPDLGLHLLRKGRRRKVEAALPYFLDLVGAFLHSGLSLTEGFRRAGREGFPASHPLAREVAIVGRELDAGKEPSAALRDLGERTGVPALRAVAAALRMGMRLGAPIEETLRFQSDALWTKRREDAMQQLQKAEIKMMLPVALMGFPMFAVLALFPVIMDLIEVLTAFFGVL